MKLNSWLLEEYRDIHKSIYGFDLSHEHASKEASSLMNLVSTVLESTN